MRDLLIATLLLLLFESLGIYLRRIFEKTTKELLNDKSIIPSELIDNRIEKEDAITILAESVMSNNNVNNKKYKKEVIAEIVEGRNSVNKLTEAHTRLGFIFGGGLLLVWFYYYLGNFPFSIIISLLLFALTIGNYFVYSTKRKLIIKKLKGFLVEYNIVNN